MIDAVTELKLRGKYPTPKVAPIACLAEDGGQRTSSDQHSSETSKHTVDVSIRSPPALQVPVCWVCGGGLPGRGIVVVQCNLGELDEACFWKPLHNSARTRNPVNDL